MANRVLPRRVLRSPLISPRWRHPNVRHQSCFHLPADLTLRILVPVFKCDPSTALAFMEMSFEEVAALLEKAGETDLGAYIKKKRYSGRILFNLTAGKKWPNEAPWPHEAEEMGVPGFLKPFSICWHLFSLFSSFSPNFNSVVPKVSPSKMRTTLV